MEWQVALNAFWELTAYEQSQRVGALGELIAIDAMGAHGVAHRGVDVIYNGKLNEVKAKILTGQQRLSTRYISPSQTVYGNADLILAMIFWNSNQKVEAFEIPIDQARARRLPSNRIYLGFLQNTQPVWASA